VRRVLSIAGSDPSGHAGLQADLKVFEAHGVWGMAVPTVLTVQDARRVYSTTVLEPALVRAQIRAVLPSAAVVKVGMVGTGAMARMLAEELLGARVVLDPVLVSSSGAVLMDEPDALLELAAISELVTPNLPEAEALPGLLSGPAAVLLKGGHGEGDTVVDQLLGGPSFSRPRLSGAQTRGTGCRLSSAIAARLALGEELESAVGGAGNWLHAELARSR
jgi:hydroxymethylpyrimidine/phosphomethylpyrimidine kinase